MPGRKMLCLGVTTLLLTSGAATARHGGGGHMHHGGGHRNGFPGMPLVAVGGGYAGYGYAMPYYVGGPGYYDPYYPGMMTMGTAGFASQFGPVPPPLPMRGPLLQPPPPQAVAQWGRAAKPAVSANDPKRAAQLLTFGDRLFRAGNLKKAEERYVQARNAASNQAAPHLRLAQIALTRGNYTEAANRLRDAETAEPGWVLTAPDIQSLYGEPTEFSRHVMRLESYVQSHPDDRDAWLVLGAQWFLSGRTTRAADVFLRLDDPRRKPDVALAAFLIAVNHAGPNTDDDDNATR